MTHLVILRTQEQRDLAKRLVDKAPDGFVVTIKEQTRTGEQNNLLWAILSDVARAKPDGRNLSADVWKCLFMASIGCKVTFETSLDGDGVVPLGFKSSRMSKALFSDLIEAIYSYGALHNVVWSDTKYTER